MHTEPTTATVEVTSEVGPTLPTDDIPDVIVFVDLETTGLDERLDLPLELGIKVTDRNLKVLHEKSWLVKNEGWKERLEKTPQVERMHTFSGLVGELDALTEDYIEDGKCYTHDSTMVSYLAWKWLTDTLNLPDEVYPLAGSSVHFDRKFLHKYFIVLESFFHYRNIDVSTVKELCKIFSPALAAQLGRITDKQLKWHRVLSDIDATIFELAFYRDNFFRSMVDLVNDVVGQMKIEIEGYDE